MRETSFQASLRNCINSVHCDDDFFIFRNVIVTTFFPSPRIIGNFRASSSVTVFKALPTMLLLVTRVRGLHSAYWSNDVQSTEKWQCKASNVCKLSCCIISNHREEYTCNPRIKHRLLLFDLRAEDMYGNEKLFSAQNYVKNKTKNNNNDDDNDNMDVL